MERAAALTTGRVPTLEEMKARGSPRIDDT